eukprot:TRINITY_DN6220_c0_g2_i1.p1 TRINITY_DN6220_c0_g2~~TRINITY_DN6220_c0_g2_i1.p1  ORF type:complete len:559 (+),score=36.43 TRINITY_DN6220_c0_g2_i1:54-1730(+)
MACYRLWLHPLHRRKSLVPLRINELQRASSHDERIAVLREVCAEASTYKVDVAKLTEVVVHPDALFVCNEEVGNHIRLPLRLSQICGYDILQSPEERSNAIVGCISYAFPMTAYTARGQESEVSEMMQGDMWVLIVTDSVPCATLSKGTSAVFSQALNCLISRGAISGDTSAYQLIDESVAKGGFGTVSFFQRTHDVNNDLYAGKLLDDQAMSACAECDYLLSARSHPNIVAYVGTFCFWSSSQERKWMIVTEGHLGGDMRSRVRRCGAFSDSEALQVLEGVLKAVSHLHDHGIIHRDVKPANVVLASDGRAVLIDLGIAVHVSESARRKKVCGTPGFTAPEILHRRGCQFKSDVFGCGALLYFIASGKVPFAGSSKNETMKLNARARVNFDDTLFLTIAPHTIELMHDMLQRNPNRRPSARSVCNAVTSVIEATSAAALPGQSPVTPDHHVSKPAISSTQASSSTWQSMKDRFRLFSRLKTADVLNSFNSFSSNSSMPSSTVSSNSGTGPKQDAKKKSKPKFFLKAQELLSLAGQVKRAQTEVKPFVGIKEVRRDHD